ncbi:DNA polymerase III subunit delta' [Limibaculum sp. M0105]|uniref:DNA polymerase III subunit delta n=1 Tax=Thermohalobaculum xanthum TaxID=2753746 RepID=A0A8J7M6M5_9RHOB|nr:DNA polymerase III subunit delta' [Thermohalobaculum xanthum]MBK0398499.1 DNA polymerase III subunit delta' [Thermohalobaculum xanthum]
MSDTLPEPDRVPGHPHPRDSVHLIGQGPAERAFLDVWRAGRLHHAWLLRGPRGIGKATLAYRIARALIAAPTDDAGPSLFGGDAAIGPSVPDTLDPPDACPVLTRIRAGAEPRLAVLRRGLNDKSRPYSVIRIDEVRDLRRFLGLSAADGGWRAVVVDAADEMNVQAQNAILKMLEEPPARTAFLLVSHSPAALLPTIRSRCRTLDLAPLSPADLAAALEAAGAPVDPSGQAALAELAGGSVGAALRLLEGDGLELCQRVIAALSGGGCVDRTALIALADAVGARGAETRYALALDLIIVVAGRLARHAAGITPAAEVARGEAQLASRIARHPAQAALWAEAASRLAARTAHARAVNLDPAQTIMDTLLDLDDTLARARAAA